MTAAEMLDRQRTPEETQRAYRALQEDVMRSPWGQFAQRLLMVEMPVYIIQPDGRLERGPDSAAVKFALDQHALYVRDAARRHGFEVPE